MEILNSVKKRDSTFYRFLYKYRKNINSLKKQSECKKYIIELTKDYVRSILDDKKKLSKLYPNTRHSYTVYHRYILTNVVKPIFVKKRRRE